MLGEMGGDKEDVGRIKVKVKDDTMGYGTNHKQSLGKGRGGSEKDPRLRRLTNQ
jgi:hypothetical protein